MLAVFSAPALEQPEQASPERVGEYRQTQPFYRALGKSVNRTSNGSNVVDRVGHLRI
jgi:hypothetical protein